MKDKFGREIDYLRVSVTDNCNLRCIYCMDEKNNKFLKNDEKLTDDEIYKVIKESANLGIKKVRITGGEPLVRQGIVKLISKINTIPGIEEIYLTTNGILLADMIDELAVNGLKGVNISLDSLKEERFNKLTRLGKLDKVLKAIDKAIDLGIKVKLNTVIVNDINKDEILDFVKLTIEKPIDVRFIELMPLGEGEYFYENGYFNISKLINDIDELYKIEDEKGSTARLYQAKYAKGRIGIITPISCKFCNTCNRIRITSDGKIKLCLHSNEETDIRYYLNKPMIFKEVLKEIILKKPDKHNLLENNSSDTYRQMYEIGG